MSLTEETRKPDKQELRRFGVIMGFVTSVLFGLVLPWLFGRAHPLWPFVFAGVMFAAAAILPAALHPVYAVWMRFGLLMNWINTRILLGLVFYAVILPMGLLMKAMGRDPMARRYIDSAPSYRITKRVQSERKHMERPF